MSSIIDASVSDVLGWHHLKNENKKITRIVCVDKNKFLPAVVMQVMDSLLPDFKGYVTDLADRIRIAD